MLHCHYSKKLKKVYLPVPVFVDLINKVLKPNVFSSITIKDFDAMIREG